MQNRTKVFIDGLNIYHSIDNFPELNPCKWINLFEFCKIFIPNISPSDIYYFTTKVTWDIAKANAHQTLIDVYEDIGINVIPGEFKVVERKCGKCHEQYNTHEEKKTDVNIALYLVTLAFKNEFDTAYLISGDNDLLPPLQYVKSNFEDKKLGLIKPMGMRVEDLKNSVDYFRKIKREYLINCKIDNPYCKSDGTLINCPSRWLYPRIR